MELGLADKIMVDLCGLSFASNDTDSLLVFLSQLHKWRGMLDLFRINAACRLHELSVTAPADLAAAATCGVHGCAVAFDNCQPHHVKFWVNGGPTDLGQSRPDSEIPTLARLSVPAMDLVRNAYGALAAQYIDLFGSIDHMHPDDLDLITRHLVFQAGIVLDVGCGPGHLTQHLRSLGVDAVGIDVVPEFIDHARVAYPHGHFVHGSMDRLGVAEGTVAAVLAWYSLIHVPPTDIHRVLAEFRQTIAEGGLLVIGFFDGEEIAPFEHRVATAYYWPVDELSAELERAGFTEIERIRRPGENQPGRRPHAAIVATASELRRRLR
jgi:SAM-dependent methyltransferase